MAIDQSKLKAMRFESELVDHLKRHHPWDYACAVSAKIDAALKRRVKPGQWRPHDLLHSIEANCASHRRNRRELVTEHRLAKVMNVYANHPDQYVEHLLSEEKKLHLAFRVMFAQQIPIQYQPNYLDLGRCYILYVKDDPLPETAEWLKAKHRLTPYEWFALASGILAMTMGHTPATATPQALRNFKGWKIGAEAIESFLRLSSRTPNEISGQYHREREEIEKPYLRGLIPSGFLRKPLMRFDSTYLAPLPSLVARYLADGIYEVCRQHAHVFGRELSVSFERYVASVLSLFNGCQRIIEADALESATPGRSCDFLLEFPDSIVLVECKATNFAARFLTDKSISQDNSTTKIVEATEQLVATARAILEGALGSILSSSHKPLIPIVVTYGGIPLVNSPWYRKEILAPRLQQKLEAFDDWPAPFHCSPQVFSIAVLEQFVLAQRAIGESVAAMIEKKQVRPYLSVGDWDVFLPTLVADKRTEQLPMAHEAIEEFFEGIAGRERFAQWRTDTDVR